MIEKVLVDGHSRIFLFSIPLLKFAKAADFLLHFLHDPLLHLNAIGSPLLVSFQILLLLVQLLFFSFYHIVESTLLFYVHFFVEGRVEIHLLSEYLVAVSLQQSQGYENVEGIVNPSLDIHFSLFGADFSAGLDIVFRFVVELVDKFSSNFFVSSFLLVRYEFKGLVS